MIVTTSTRLENKININVDEIISHKLNYIKTSSHEHSIS